MDHHRTGRHASRARDGRRPRLVLDGIGAGTNARLVIRLVNNDSDRGSAATVQCVTLTPGIDTTATKFYVVDAAADRIFGHDPQGLTTGSFAVAEQRPTGI